MNAALANAFTAQDYFLCAPAFTLAIFAVLVLLLDTLLPTGARTRTWLFLTALSGAALASWQTWQRIPHAGATAFQGAVHLDGLALAGFLLLMICLLGALLGAWRFLESTEADQAGAFYCLLLLAQCGVFFVVSSVELITQTIALELAAISYYLLAAFLRQQYTATEAALKYLILGAFSNAFLLYGFATLYGATGSTLLPTAPATTPGLSLQLAAITILCGLLFKLAAVPFHAWAPDVYEGSSALITGVIAVISRTSSFVLLLRFAAVLPRETTEVVLVIAALLSLAVGGIASLTQHNIARLIAWGATAHTGFVLLGIVSFRESGWYGSLVYAGAYAVMTMSTFLLLSWLQYTGERAITIEDLRGLSGRRPAAAAGLFTCLLALAGIPPTVGFIAKWFVLQGLIEAGQLGFAIVAGAYVPLAIYVYFRIGRALFERTAEASYQPLTDWPSRIAVACFGLATLLLGVFPERLLLSARFAMQEVWR
jgi:NADH-quinone oxidoreductase subunit N